MKKIFIEAHKMTKEMVKEYEVDYQAQFGLCLSYLLEKKEEKEMLKGTEKQVKWAENIKTSMIKCLETLVEATSLTFADADSKMSENSKKIFNLGFDLIKDTLEKVKQESTATWFIDRRGSLNEESILSLKHGNKNFTTINISKMYDMSFETLTEQSIELIYNATADNYIDLY